MADPGAFVLLAIVHCQGLAPASSLDVPFAA